MKENNSLQYKVVFLGDQSVGKTSIINRFMFDMYDEKDHPTIGIDFITKVIRHNNNSIRIQIWDTAGQERFRTLIPSYIRDSSVAILVFDLTSSQSFLHIKSWYEDVRKQRGDNVILFLIGNKSDLKEEREISQEDALLKSRELQINYIEVSAKEGINISIMFDKIAEALEKRFKIDNINNTNTEEEKKNISLTSSPVKSQNYKKEIENKKSKCC